MKNELYELYQQCFPTTKVSKETFLEKLDYDHSDVIIEQEHSRITGACVVNGNAVLLLCVDKKDQHKGYGTKLLKAAEEMILERGFETVVLGCGKTYLYQGVPMDEQCTWKFFEKFGFHADWESVDLQVELDEFRLDEKVGKEPDNIDYEIMTKESRHELYAAVESVIPDWCRYFKTCKEAVMVAKKEERIVGFEILSQNVKDMGVSNQEECDASLGCVGVIPNERNKGIGLSLAAHGLQYLKEQGCKKVFIGYTGLESWYAKLGAKTQKRFWMGKKQFEV